MPLSEGGNSYRVGQNKANENWSEEADEHVDEDEAPGHC